MFSSMIINPRYEIERADGNDVKLHDRNEDLLLVDDDGPFRRSLSQALERRGFTVLPAETLQEARMLASEHRPTFAVLDLRVGNQNGLDLLDTLRKLRPDVRIVMVTGYGNIASAVMATKAGAVDYLAKPLDADDVVNALCQTNREPPTIRDKPMSASRVRWEHILRVYEQCDRNVSDTARRLNMHRRSLQRILSKRAPRE